MLQPYVSSLTVSPSCLQWAAMVRPLLIFFLYTVFADEHTFSTASVEDNFICLGFEEKERTRPWKPEGLAVPLQEP